MALTSTRRLVAFSIGERGVEARRDRVRREEVGDGVAAQRELVEVVVELHRRPARLHAGAAARRRERELQRGGVARHLRQALAGEIAAGDGGVAEEVAGGDAPLFARRCSASSSAPRERLLPRFWRWRVMSAGVEESVTFAIVSSVVIENSVSRIGPLRAPSSNAERCSAPSDSFASVCTLPTRKLR